MKKFIATVFVSLVLCVVSAGSSSADDSQEASDAYERGNFTTAFRLWTPLAEKGDAIAQFWLGFMYDFGEGVAENNQEAIKWYRLAAEQGNAQGQANLGLMYDLGEGVAENNREAVKWYRLSAEQGNVSGQYYLGTMYDEGEGVAENNQEAIKWYRLAAEQGNVDAQNALGNMHYNGEGVTENYREAVKWFRLSAEQGDAEGQAILGYMYYLGEGVAQNYREAMKWFRLAAVEGDATVQYMIGAMHYSGEGVAENNQEAMKWFRLAAEQGDVDAQYNLGVMYDEGEGVAENNQEAMKWFRLAAEQGDVDAQYNLGVMYDEGEGVAENNQEAIKWYRLAAEQGNVDAQYNLGVMYDEGEGVAENNQEAIKWYRLAAEQGDVDAEDKLAELQESQEQETSPSQIPDKISEPTPTPAPDRADGAQELQLASSGSGFAISKKGHLITNDHVIDECTEVFVHQEGRAFPTRTLARDQKNDIAVLVADFKPDQAFALSARNPELMQSVIVAGFPFGRIFGSSIKVTKGIVSSLSGLDNDYSNIQIDAAIQPGNSGGPILDEFGNVIGVAVSKLDAMFMLENYDTIPENINFGVKTNTVKNVLSTLSIPLERPSSRAMLRKTMSRLITDATYYLSCHMTSAQIEKMESKKVMFEAHE